MTHHHGAHVHHRTRTRSRSHAAASEISTAAPVSLTAAAARAFTATAATATGRAFGLRALATASTGTARRRRRTGSLLGFHSPRHTVKRVEGTSDRVRSGIILGKVERGNEATIETSLQGNQVGSSDTNQGYASRPNENRRDT